VERWAEAVVAAVEGARKGLDMTLPQVSLAHGVGQCGAASSWNLLVQHSHRSHPANSFLQHHVQRVSWQLCAPTAVKQQSV
jgi:hypothetical protein